MDRIYEIAYVPNWQDNLNELENMAIPEKWYYNNLVNHINNKNPILHQYLNHTYCRLEKERENAEESKKQSIIYIDDNIFCFNTGLYTKEYQEIFAVFIKNRNSNRQEWFFRKFAKSTDSEIEFIYPKPRRAKYFYDIHELVYDYELHLDPNLEHILSDEANKERIPESVSNLSLLSQLSIFEGAIVLAKKKIAANYKVAVPQYYNGKIQFLLPLTVDLADPNKVDLVLAVEKIKSNTGNFYYKGYTALTMDMAYNNARLLARIDSDWLKV